MTSPLPVLPVITVEAGFTAGVPVGAALVFLLDSVTQGILDTNTLGDTNTWTDITPYMRNFTITRTSTRVKGPLLTFQGSTCSVLLDNSDGRFDAENFAGPYVAVGASQVRPMVPLRISAVFAGTTYRLFTGFADAWTESPVTYEGGYSEVTVTASDAFKVLAGITLGALSSPVGSSESPSGRINRVLNAAGWYTDRRNIDFGATANLQATSFGSTALALMQLATDTEAGQLYVDGNGVIQFRHRWRPLYDARSAVPQAAFSDSPALSSAVTSVTAQCWGGGGGGGAALHTDAQGGGGGGGGEYASDTVTVTAGKTYAVVVGAAGAGGVVPADSAGTTGGNSTFTGDSLTVTAHGGQFGNNGVGGVNGPGGQGSTNTTHFNGGPGGIQGGGGGGSGGTAATGNAGLGTPTFAGGAAVTGGGPGGTGGGAAPGPGLQPASGPGGGGGGATNAFSSNGGAGRPGQVTLTWAGGTQTWTVPGTYLWQAGVAQYAYAAVGRANDDTQLANDIQNTAAGSANLQEAQDAASEATYLFPRTYARSDLLQISDAQALGWAQWILTLSKGAPDRIDSLTVDPQADTAGLWPQALGREIGDRIQIWKTPAGVAQFSKDEFICGITHSFDAVAPPGSPMWLTTWAPLIDAAPYGSFLLLSDTIRGHLDTGLLAF